MDTFDAFTTFIVICLAIILGLILAQAAGEWDAASENKAVDNSLKTYSKCEDGVICYYRSNGYGGGMDCFRDKDLLNKYCKEE